MRKQKTSVFYFRYSPMEVWEAVTARSDGGGFAFEPMSDEDYEAARQETPEKGKVLARVTDMTPGKSCAYELRAEKFDVYWNAEFSDAGKGECRMTMTERYEFHPGAVLPYVLAVLFLRQGRQHKDFRDAINRRLKAG